MEREKINSLIADNMKKIFSFCLSRVNNTSDAEDLAGDIFVELLRSYKNIRGDDNFYGFMWGVANNVYKQYLRKKQRNFGEIAFEESYMGNIFDTPEDIYVSKEELAYLKRELSLLSGEYREATILYYIKNKSCSEVAELLDISNEMVKYYLFRARKIMKEGMDMTREYGEKSYNPDIFKMDYWGTGPNDVYRKLFERRLPGNILLSAYYEPLSVTELALELGIATSWLEDEIKILREHDLIKLMGNGKYQTNIIIFTPEYETEVYNAAKELYISAAESLYEYIDENESAIREIGFYGSEFTKNRLYWSVLTPALLHSSNLIAEIKDFPLLSNGSRGYVFGYNRDYSGHNILGIDNADTINISPPIFTSVNYRILNNMAACDCYWNYREIIFDIMIGKSITEPEQLEQVSELIKNGIVISENGSFRINLAVFTITQFKKLLEVLNPAILEIKDMREKVNQISTKILVSHAPKALRDKCEMLAAIYNRATGEIIESMCEQNLIFVPKQTEVVSIYGIKEG